MAIPFDHGVEITAGRLHLRAWQAGDEPAMTRLLDEPAVARWTPHPSPYRLQDAAERIAGDAGHWSAGTRAELAVLDAVSGDLLGIVGLYRMTGADAEVGWASAAAARGRGVATDAVAALCRWGFAALALERLEAQVEVGNWASRRVAEKAGFTVEGTQRGAPGPAGRRADSWLLSRLSGDPERDTARIPAYADRTDGVVTLRRWRSTDGPEVGRACADPETARWLPVPVPYTAETGQQYVDAMVPGLWADGAAANVAVVDAISGALLGAIGLTLRDGIGEVGYWTAPWARGRGVATRAAVLHTDWALQVLGLPRVELLADVGNLGSQRVAERAGFVCEGVARALRPLPRAAGRADMVVYARVAAP